MRVKLIIENPNITWDEFRSLISCNTETIEILKACYRKSKRTKGLGFSKNS